MEKQRSMESWLLAKRRARLNGGGSVKVPDILRKRELTMEEKAKLRAPELFRAVKSGNTARVTKMIAIDRVDVNVKDVNGWAPLHHACIRGYSGIAQLLLGSGAMIEPLTNDRRTPLELAKIAGHGGTMTVLRKALSMQCLVAPLSAGEKELVLRMHACIQQQLSMGQDDCLYRGNRGQNNVAAKITDKLFAGRHPGTYTSISNFSTVASNHTRSVAVASNPMLSVSCASSVPQRRQRCNIIAYEPCVGRMESTTAIRQQLPSRSWGAPCFRCTPWLLRQ